jgi:hypothetical protein
MPSISWAYSRFRRRRKGVAFGGAQRTVDDAEMKYVIVHLHRLLDPSQDDDHSH